MHSIRAFFVSCSDPTLSNLGVSKGLEEDIAGIQLTQTDQRNIPCHEILCTVVKTVGSLSKAAGAERVAGHQSAGGKW